MFTGNEILVEFPASNFYLYSAQINDTGWLSRDCTCNGFAINPSFYWSNVPSGTVDYLLTMSTITARGIAYKWGLFNLSSGIFD